MTDFEAQPIAVVNDELVTVRDAMRGLNHMVEALDRGEVEKYVLMKGTRMVGVLTSVALAGGEWQRCPVCYGVSTVQAGFYSPGQSITSTARETCRCCAGRAMVLRPWHGTP